jgi:RNA recognition motif-containing protein
LLFFFTHIIPDAIIQPLFQTYTSFYNPTVSEITFLEFFEQFGDVIDSVVMIDRQTKRSRGFGFVTFADEVSSLFLFVG